MGERDFSKSTVAVLLVLAILISFLSTWTLYDQMKKTKSSDQISAPGNTQGEIRLQILSDKVQPAVPSANSQGEIHLEIVKEEG